MVRGKMKRNRKDKGRPKAQTEREENQVGKKGKGRRELKTQEEEKRRQGKWEGREEKGRDN